MTNARKRDRAAEEDRQASISHFLMENESKEDEGFEDVFEELSDEDIIMDPSMVEGVPDEDEEEICYEDVKINLNTVPIKDKYEEAEKRYKGLPKRVYLPTTPLEDGHELVHDPQTYHMFHEFQTEWPCLSFDILRDTLGNDRIRYPHTMSLVAGSQADSVKKNKIFVMKCTGLDRTRKTARPRFDSNNQSGSESSESEDEMALEEGRSRIDPVLVTRSIPHPGVVNRIRADKASPAGQAILATWSEQGKVHIWDASAPVAGLDASNPSANRSSSQKKKANSAAASGTPGTAELPMHTVHGHREEGYALDWSASLIPGRLLSGDGKGAILLTERTESAYTTHTKGFLGHTASVEDLAWSPVERHVFASVSVDQTLAIWDTRAATSVVSARVASSDVNVLSWNPAVHYLMASGSDDGSFCTWDLRYIKAATPSPLAIFSWHRGPIASIEWHPHDASVLAVSGSDDQLTLWDFSLEADMEAEEPSTGTEETSLAVPSQLLFIHQGQKDMKEVHWHPQIPGAIVSTSASSFNIFKTINI